MRTCWACIPPSWGVLLLALALLAATPDGPGKTPTPPKPCRLVTTVTPENLFSIRNLPGTHVAHVTIYITDFQGVRRAIRVPPIPPGEERTVRLPGRYAILETAFECSPFVFRANREGTGGRATPALFR